VEPKERENNSRGTKISNTGNTLLDALAFFVYKPRVTMISDARIGLAACLIPACGEFRQMHVKWAALGKSPTKMPHDLTESGAFSLALGRKVWLAPRRPAGKMGMLAGVKLIVKEMNHKRIVEISTEMIRLLDKQRKLMTDTSGIVHQGNDRRRHSELWREKRALARTQEGAGHKFTRHAGVPVGTTNRQTPVRKRAVTTLTRNYDQSLRGKSSITYLRHGIALGRPDVSVLTACRPI